MIDTRRLFIGAASIYFVLGLAGVPIAAWGGAALTTYYKAALYLLAAGIFWAWLYQDANARRISPQWQLLVAVAWLLAAIVVAPAYLVVTRGWKSGSFAALGFFGIVLGLFAVLGIGLFASTELVNSLHLMSNFPPR